MVVRYLLAVVSLIFLVDITPAIARQKAVKPTLNSWSHNSKNCHHLLSNTFQCNWVFFEMKSIAEGDILAYEQVGKASDGLMSASVAIVRTQSDIIRVLDMGNNAHKVGEHVRVTPDHEPSVDIVVPLDRDFYFSEEKKGNKTVCRVNAWDTKVLKSTWGRIAK